jgi:hypothetical protein
MGQRARMTGRSFGAARLLAAITLLLLAACSGGSPSGSGGGSGLGGSGSGGSSGGSSGGGVVLTNFAPVVVDAGPAALNTGPNAYTATNIPYVTVTVCVPGQATTCQTIDHVLLDTGSTGLRLEAEVLKPSVLAGLGSQTDPAGNAIGECYQFVDNYVFGSVRTADFSIGGESVAAMPMMVIGDSSGGFGTVPKSCSTGGGTDMNTVQALGANGIIGVGLAPLDCGSACNTARGSGGAIYYDCPATGCATVIARAQTSGAPYEQLPNPVAAFATDNNGTILSLPTVPATGVVTLTGQITFGIGTQTNNALGSATVLPTNNSGEITATYNGKALSSSFFDSGSNYYYFTDASIPQCTQTGLKGFYCPTSALSLSPTLTGYGSGTASATFMLYNASSEPGPTSNAVPGIGADPNALSFSQPINNSFDFGLPFFFGRTVYTAISGRKAGTQYGPYFAF